jgi:hypothetical protein
MQQNTFGARHALTPVEQKRNAAMIDETRYRETTATTEARPRIDVSTSAAESTVVEYPDFNRKRTAWGAIWAGVLVSFGVQALLTLLGAAIGLTVLGAQQGANMPDGLGVGAGIWWVITGIISLFIGGWTVAYLLGPRPTFVGALHGFVMWCTVTAISAFLLTTATSSILGGGMNMLGSAASAQQQNQGNQGLMDRVRQSDNPDSPGDDPDNPIDSPREQERVDKAEKATAGATWWTFFALLLGATAAIIGGCMTPDREDVYRRRIA